MPPLPPLLPLTTPLLMHCLVNHDSAQHNTIISNCFNIHDKISSTESVVLANQSVKYVLHSRTSLWNNTAQQLVGYKTGIMCTYTCVYMNHVHKVKCTKQIYRQYMYHIHVSIKMIITVLHCL